MTPQTEQLDRVPVTARLNAHLHTGLTKAAEDLDLSVNALLNRAVAEWLVRQDTLPELELAPAVELRPMTGPNAYRVAVDGYAVPFLTASKCDPPAGVSSNGDAFGWATLILDNRFQTAALRWDQFWPAAWMIANALAIGAGFSCHGPNATRLNPHGPAEAAADSLRWAEHGWVNALGTGRTYELALTFRLPAMDGADLQVHGMREHLVRLAENYGARDVMHRTVALAPLQAEPSGSPVAAEPIS